MKIELTQDEAQAIVNLIDAAVRAQGLQAAVVALPLVQKLQNAAKQQEPANG